MRNVKKFIILLVVATSVIALTLIVNAALPANEPYTGSAGVLVDTPWHQYVSGSNLRRVAKDGLGNGKPNGDGSAGDDAVMYWDSATDTFGNDQYSQYTAKFVGLGTGLDYLYLFARVTGGADYQTGGSFYMFWTDGGSDTVLLYTTAGNSSLVSLGTSNATVFTSGDIFKLSCVGTTISVAKNGSNIISVTDSHVTSGQPGMGGSGATVVLFDDWQANNIGGGSNPKGTGLLTLGGGPGLFLLNPHRFFPVHFKF